MLIKLLIGLVIVLGLLAAYISSRPAAFRVTRSLAMAAPPAAIFQHVNDFRQWGAWSPFDKYDPAIEKTYEGSPEGTGAIYRWSGNSQVGEGSTTITESKPFDRIRMRLQFKRPFTCDNPVEFTFQPRGPETVVTWDMTGKYNFVTKAIGLVMNMDKMTGDQFNAGLANLKRIVEKGAGLTAVI